MNLDFNLNSYDFHLPPELIAERPVEGRHHSRLLIYKKSSGEIIHADFLNITDYIPAGSLMAFNETKVFPCRLKGKKSTGGKCELFILNTSPRNGLFHCLMKTSGKKKIGETFSFSAGLIATLIDSGSDGTFWVKFNQENLTAYLENHGSVPIPPYIRKGDADRKDREDYQTVFAKNIGSVAAPTAGLHFTNEVFNKLDASGIDRAFVTLHVGMGTFAPVKSEDIRDHKMHGESYHLTAKNLEKIKESKNTIAVGTTSLRVLESSLNKKIVPDKTYETDIFLHPGKEIKSIQGLLTNFHLPKSSLLMLISCLIGREQVMRIYTEAVDKKYRFFSYGDAMLILP